MLSYPTTVAIGDTHFPFTIWPNVERVIAAISAIKPKNVVQLGDLYDLYSFAKFPRSHNIYTPLQEIENGRRLAETFWANIRKAAPRAKLWQLKGNHDARPFKRVQEACPELGDHLALSKLWLFDGVETMADDRDALVIKKVLFQHGYRRHGDHVRHNRQSTVCGHIHTGGVIYVRQGKESLFELNAGFLGNPNCTPLGYTPLRRISSWTQGFGILDSLGPRFVSLPNP
jgi:hypothetical protein